MRTLVSFVSLASVATLALAGGAAAQTITSVTPEAVAPGTPMTIRGTGLASTTHVRFQAIVGGFVGIWSQDEPVVSASATEVHVLAPDIVAGFVFGGVSDGSPFAQLQTVAPGGTSAQVDVYLFEGSNGFLSAAGLGSTHAGGARATASFDLAGGPPTSPNPAFVATVHDAQPGAASVLAVGLPLAPAPFADGLLAVNPNALFATLLGTPVDALGDASRALAIPSVSGLTVGMQWATVDTTTLAIDISNAMHVAY